MPRVRIRTAGVHEREALEELQRRASLNNPGDRAALMAHPEAIHLPPAQVASGNVFVAQAGRDILGFAAIERRADGGIELDGLFVEPAHWRRGIGRGLVAHCLDKAAAVGAPALHVIGNPHAESFYRACGFIVAGTIPMQFGPGLRMSIDVTGRTP